MDLNFEFLDELEREIAIYLSEYNEKVWTPNRKKDHFINGGWSRQTPFLKIILFERRLNKCQYRIERTSRDVRSIESINRLDRQNARLRQLRLLLTALAETPSFSEIALNKVIDGIDVDRLIHIKKVVDLTPAKN